MNNKKEAGSSAAKLQNSLLFSIRDHKRLLLRDVFADIQCDRYDDNDTLYNVLIVGRDSKELHGGFQQLEYENTDDNTGDTADTTVYGYTADGAGCDCLQLVTLTHVNAGTAGLCAEKEACDCLQSGCGYVDDDLGFLYVNA